MKTNTLSHSHKTLVACPKQARGVCSRVFMVSMAHMPAQRSSYSHLPSHFANHADTQTLFVPALLSLLSLLSLLAIGYQA
ncbi:hypothetical protein [Brackiella oedipodis]|uniref:hypothetical protein n=1 Tax=Brackiella oedipodis TaxID=124225 RepID=UPI0012EB3C51|nr:hypothetical protein [Brackiella oedipodis]